MKYTRLEIHKGISNTKIKIIIGFFIIIPMIAVLSGSIITKILIPREKITGLSSNIDEPATASSQSAYYDYKIFFLQAGAFISKNNADVLKEAIKSEDIAPVVIQDNGIYRVIISMSDNKELITEKKDKLQTQGFNCLINEFSFSSIDKSNNEEIAIINKYIKTAADIIKLQVEINGSFSQMDKSRIDTLKEYNTDLFDRHAEIEKINTASDIKEFSNSFEQFTNDYIKNYETGDLDKCQLDTGQQILLLNNYYNEVHVLRKYST